jgi:DNA polymerase I-like protein with 3'-5' exonuclease and polymerase domains
VTYDELPGMWEQADLMGGATDCEPTSMTREILDRLHVEYAEPVSIDIETTGTALYQGDIVRGFAVSVGDDSWYTPLTHPGSANMAPDEARAIVRAVQLHDVVPMHNSPFDRTGLALTFGVEFEDGQIWDTQTVDWLINENLDHRLKEIGARLFGSDAKAEKLALDELKRGRTVDEVYRELRELENLLPKAEREKAVVTRARAREIAEASRKSWATFTAADIADYAMQDTELTLALYHWQQQFLADNPDYAPAVVREFRVAGLAYRMQRTGIRVDPDVAAAALEVAETRAAELAAEWSHVNLKSPLQVQTMLYEEWGLPCTRRTKTGGRSTDKAALQAIAFDPRVERLMEYRTLTKQIDAFYVPLLDKIGTDGRVHPSWNAHRVVTGRWSCSQPNLQQVPREGAVRTVFQPESGFTFVGADLPNAELRIAAILADETLWIEAFEAGRDLHQEMANAASIPRQVGKTLNFSSLYGVGSRKLAQTLAQGTGTAPDEKAARRMLAAYWRAIPRVKRLFDGLGEAWVRRGKLPILPWAGRFRHREGRLGFPEAQYKALNSIIQGSVGEAVKDWLLALEPEVARLGGRIVAQVHDSIVLEVPVGREGAATELLQSTWDRVNPFVRLPWPLDTKVGAF